MVLIFELVEHGISLGELRWEIQKLRMSYAQ